MRLLINLADLLITLFLLASMLAAFLSHAEFDRTTCRKIKQGCDSTGDRLRGYNKDDLDWGSVAK